MVSILLNVISGELANSPKEGILNGNAQKMYTETMNVGVKAMVKPSHYDHI